jgi:WD40 repeat protein
VPLRLFFPQIWDAHAPNLGLIQLTHFPAHKFSQVIAVQISSDGAVIATGGADFAVKLFKREPLGAAWKEVVPSGSGHTGIVTSVNFR